ncbi:MAG: uracil-DNA glycosylase [Ignavibacteriae bacterium]|nr:uracil-DNA glycosylase [Ignavibacteriota bacterium]MCB9217436.1 uracil-DNA glycosylase [Ignavibacteria bacterium]
MSETLKDKAIRFAEQQHLMYGDVILKRRVAKAEGEDVSLFTTEDEMELFENESESSWFAEKLRGIKEEWVTADSLDTLQQMICNCRKCQLWEGRNKFVFGTGNPNADVVVIGEAPGADEDRLGEPFVGAAGKLLTKILEAINFSRDDVYICNILKSRPPGNRRPEPSEVEACIPYLYKQLELIKPRFILAVGLTAAKALLGTNKAMKDLRGNLHNWHGIPMIITYHPAALLRNPQWKRPTWEDVQLLRKLYDESKEQKS